MRRYWSLILCLSVLLVWILPSPVIGAYNAVTLTGSAPARELTLVVQYIFVGITQIQQTPQLLHIILHLPIQMVVVKSGVFVILAISWIIAGAYGIHVICTAGRTFMREVLVHGSFVLLLFLRVGRVLLLPTITVRTRFAASRPNR